MLNAIVVSIRFIFLILGGQKQVALENAALRQQLAVFKRNVPRPKLNNRDRLFWIGLYLLWQDWKSALIFVQPETVTSWHRKRFRRYWWRLSQPKQLGRPRIRSEIRKLIHTMAIANPTWGAPRVHGELKKLGFKISERTVSRLMPKKTGKPSQTWMTFLRNHVGQMISVDFFTVPTIQLRVLYVFVILAHDRRRVLHFNVTENPTAAWTAQQIVESFPEEMVPRYLVRDLMGSMVMISRHESMDWVSDKFRHRPEVLGRTAMRNGLSEVFARMLEPRDRDQRVASASNTEKLLQLLPSLEDASVAG
jgi:hypothetical protein